MRLPYEPCTLIAALLVREQNLALDDFGDGRLASAAGAPKFERVVMRERAVEVVIACHDLHPFPPDSSRAATGAIGMYSDPAGSQMIKLSRARVIIT